MQWCVVVFVGCLLLAFLITNPLSCEFMSLTSLRYYFRQTLVNKEITGIVSICVSLIYPVFTEHIRAFKFRISAKTRKTDWLISKRSVYFRSVFMHLWQEHLLQIIWPRQSWQWGHKQEVEHMVHSPCQSACTCFQWALHTWPSVLVFLRQSVYNSKHNFGLL